VRGYVLTCFVLSLLAPPLLQVAHAARRTWSPWLEICSTDPRQTHAPDRNDASWVPVRTALAVPRLKGPRSKVRRN